MLKSYLKIAWRNLLKDRQFTLLNLLGLSVGLACTLLIGLWVTDERQMEKYNSRDSRLYQVMVNRKSNDGIQTGSYTQGILAGALRTDIPEVADASVVLPASWFGEGGLVVYGDKKFKARPQFTDSNFFHLFDCPWLEGDKRQLFADKQGVAVSAAFAQKVFGTTHNVIGKMLHYGVSELSGDFVVRGVFEPNPANATEQFDLLFNFGKWQELRTGMTNWNNSDPDTYVLVRPGTDIGALNKKIANFVALKSGEADQPPNFLVKFSDRYLYNRYENGIQAGGRIVYVRLFTIIALFILVIACINFMNLSTAKAAHRAKEVGIKKVVGAGRGALILQYLGESLLLAMLSMGAALLIIWMLLPEFNQITGKRLVLQFAPALIGTVLGVAVLTGLAAGSYPAFYLSSFRPVEVLKGNLGYRRLRTRTERGTKLRRSSVRSSLGELWMRKGLVVFQFTLSVIFIAAVLVVYKQVAYIQSRDLGYKRDHVIHFEIPVEMDSAKIAAGVSFVNELRSLTGVVNTSSYGSNLMGDHGMINGVKWPGKDMKTDIDFANIEVGYNFLETAGIKLTAGRNVSQNANSIHEIIMNESAIKAMGIKDPIGKTVSFWDEKREIVGVAADFNFESLYQQVRPAFFRVYPVFPTAMVRLQSGSEEQTIERVKAAYNRFNPGMPFEYKFLNEDYQQLYASEIRVGVLSRYFAGLAILISCLGLFGLAAFTAQKRKKEIGIRKVVGASAARIAFLLSKEFVALVGVAILIAFPLVWIGMHKWLEGFAYRVSVGAGVFLITAVVAMVITLLTIGYQSLKAAWANPAESLRTE
jgi:putative ABC transport system permease protein